MSAEIEGHRRFNINVDSTISDPALQIRRLDDYPVLKSFLAGSFSGTFSTILFQPLDLVKTRLQNFPHNSTCARTNGMIKVFSHILKKEQLLGLWTGITPSITRCVPGVGLYFSSLHWLKTNAVTHVEGDLSPLQAVTLGVVARAMSGAVLIPITVIKTRYESGVYNYASVGQALRIIYRTEGLRGLCCGLTATLVRDAPFSGLYLMFYTQSKQALPTEFLTSPYSSATHFSCGVTAGILASAVTHPADVIKTQMQLYPGKFASVFQAIVHVNQTMGPRGYFRGIAPRMLRRTLMAAMAWTVYEQITMRMGLK